MAVTSTAAPRRFGRTETGARAVGTLLIASAMLTAPYRARAFTIDHVDGPSPFVGFAAAGRAADAVDRSVEVVFRDALVARAEPALIASRARSSVALDLAGTADAVRLDRGPAGAGGDAIAYTGAGGLDVGLGDKSAVFLDGDITFVEPEDGDSVLTLRGDLGLRTVLDELWALGVYTSSSWVDVEPDSVWTSGAGVLAGLHLELGGITLSGGAVVQGAISGLDLSEDELQLDPLLAVAYGAAVGAPIGERLALNAMVHRTTPFGPRGEEDFQQLESWTTLELLCDVAVSAEVSVNASYRTRFELDDYRSHAARIGVRLLF